MNPVQVAILTVVANCLPNAPLFKNGRKWIKATWQFFILQVKEFLNLE